MFNDFCPPTVPAPDGFWELLFTCLHTSLDEISQILETRNIEGELMNSLPPSYIPLRTPTKPISGKNTFVAKTAAEICL